MGTFRVKLDAMSFSSVSLSPDGLPPEPVLAFYNFNIPPFYTTIDTKVAEYMTILDNNDINIGGLFQGIAGSSSVTVDFQAGNEIILDGNEGNPVTFNGLPAGFTIITAEVVMSIEAQPYSVGISANLFLKQGNVTESSPFSLPIDSVFHVYSFPFDDVSNTLAVLTNGCGFRVVPNDAVVGFAYLYITGTYITQSFQWTLHTPPSPGVNPGTTSIQVTSNAPSVPATLPPPSLEPLDFNHVDHYEIQFPDPDDPDETITYTVPGTSSSSTNEVTFVTPVFTNGETPPVITVVAVGDGTQFGGEIVLGQLLTIYFTDGSGIYKLVPEKTNDTLYVHDSDPVQTVDVKIPNPFVKTGFLP